MTEMIRVLVADDSPFICRLITSYLQSEPGIEVIATALNGRRAAKLVLEHRPDAVTLDLEMPGSNGLEAVQRIMRECPMPVVVISGVTGRAATMTLQALDLGAVDFVLKYTPGVDTDPEVLRREIIAKVKAAARIKVVRSLLPAVHGEDGADDVGIVLRQPQPVPDAADATFQVPGGLVVIGASTGGPMAVRELLSSLPADYPAAIVIVQHIPASFTGALASQLDHHCAVRVKEAEAGERLSRGVAQVAPGGFHLLITPDSRIRLRRGPAINGHCPSIDVAMQSAAQVYGARAVGIALTGMGDDGAHGMLAIRSKGGRTFAQDEESSVVYGMPLRAVEQGVVDTVAPPRRIAELMMLEQQTGDRQLAAGR